MVMLAAPSVPCKWINILCNHCWRVISLKRAGPIFCYTESTPTLTVFQIHSRWQNRRLDLFPFDPSFGCIDRNCCWWNIIPYHEASSFSCGHSSMDSHPASILCWQNVVYRNGGVQHWNWTDHAEYFWFRNLHTLLSLYIYIHTKETPSTTNARLVLVNRVWSWPTIFFTGKLCVFCKF